LPLLLYVILLLIDAIKLRSFVRGILVMPGIFVNHIVYGAYFIAGLLKSRLKEEVKK